MANTYTKQAYSLRARKHLKSKCEKCGSTKSLTAHHRDKNKANNEAKNIRTLCKACHDGHHSNSRKKK